MTVGDRIRQLREQNSLSRNELAEKLGVSALSVGLWETNQAFPAEELTELGTALQVSTDVLLGKSGAAGEEISDGVICTAVTRWTESLLTAALKIIYKQSQKKKLAAMIAFLLLGIVELLSDGAEEFIITSFVFAFFLFLLFFRIKKSMGRKIRDSLRDYPDKVTEFFFHNSYFDFHSHSRSSSSFNQVYYWEIEKVFETDEFIVVCLRGQYAVIAKAGVQGNLDWVSSVLRSNAKQYRLGRAEPESTKNPMSRRYAAVMKIVLLVLFVLSFFCLPAAMALVASVSNRLGPGAALTENMWLFFLLVPVPLTSLVLGVIYKKKGLKSTKNIVAGIILTAFLCIYGSFTFIFSGLYTHNFSYVDSIAKEINFDLPDTGSISTQDWTTGTQTSSDTVYYYCTSDVRFTDNSDTAAFEMALNGSNLWVTSVSTPLSSIIPSMYSVLTAKYDYIMVYNVDLDTYNTVPDKSGTYRFIYLAYNSDDNTMQIGEYTCTVVL